MLLNGTLNQSAAITLTETVEGVSYSGSPKVNLEKQVRSPEFTKGWFTSRIIDAPLTLDIWEGAKATPSGTITYGTPANGSTVVITGPEGGPYTFTKVAATPTGIQFTTITELAALIAAVPGLDATEDGTAITLTVTVAGTGPNAWTVTGTSSYSALSLTFSSGTDPFLLDFTGNLMGFAEIGTLAIRNTSEEETLTVGGGANAVIAELPPISPGGAISLALLVAADATHKNLLLTPGGELNFELLILGT